MTINYARFQDYMTALANQAFGDITQSPHKAFWTVDYATFKAGSVPGVKCQGADIPNINAAAPSASAILQILQDPNGFCNKEQMPAQGPFLTDPALQLQLPGGATVAGPTALADIRDWFAHGAPEH